MRLNKSLLLLACCLAFTACGNRNDDQGPAPGGDVVTEPSDGISVPGEPTLPADPSTDPVNPADPVGGDPIPMPKPPRPPIDDIPSPPVQDPASTPGTSDQTAAASVQK